MPFHMVAFTKLDTAAASNEDIPGVNDQWAILNNASHYLLPQDMWLAAAYWQNAGATNARINTPHYRFVGMPSLQPVNRTAAPVSISPMVVWRPQKLIVPKIDDVTFEASNDGAGAVRGIGGLWLSDDNWSLPSAGQIYTMRFTGTITAVTLAWTSGNLTAEQGLPAGRYAVVGMDVIGTNLVFARLIFPGGIGPNGMRPGVLARPTPLIYQDDEFRRGNFGHFGSFESTAIPLLEIFSNGANTAQTVFLDLMRLT